MNSHYYVAWEEYLKLHPEITQEQAQAMVMQFQGYEEMMFAFIMSLCS